MKKALALIANLSAIISIQPVFAVDYVACREMLRTKNEMINLAKEKDKGYTEIYIYPKCPDYVKWLEAEKESNAGYERVLKSINVKLTPKSIPGAIALNCLSKVKSYRTTYDTFFSSEAIGFAKGAEKVLQDMRKEKCPYE
jgi:hypothetical protein